MEEVSGRGLRGGWRVLLNCELGWYAVEISSEICGNGQGYSAMSNQLLRDNGEMCMRRKGCEGEI